MLTQLRPAIVLTVLFILLTGIAYPLAITGVAQLAMPYQANGSLIRKGDTVIGSALIGQNFASVTAISGRDRQSPPKRLTMLAPQPVPTSARPLPHLRIEWRKRLDAYKQAVWSVWYLATALPRRARASIPMYPRHSPRHKSPVWRRRAASPTQKLLPSLVASPKGACWVLSERRGSMCCCLTWRSMRRRLDG